jgi:ABC-type multidrug transport system fused ATPase/permease subunit
MSDVSFFDQFDAWVIFVALLVAMVCAWWVGWWIGQRQKVEGREPPAEKLGDASFTLLALLLAFTVGMALQKHDNRRQMVVAQSNAVGDFYTCAGLLREPLRDQLQEVIRNYTRLLMKARGQMHGPTFGRDLQQATQDTDTMSDLVRQAGDDGSPYTVPLTNSLNELTSMQAARLSAFEDRLPTVVVLLLFMTAIISMGLTGWRHGAVATPQRLGPSFIIVLFALVIYVILDLDHPTRGLIQVSQAPMERLVASMEK